VRRRQRGDRRWDHDPRANRVVAGDLDPAALEIARVWLCPGQCSGDWLFGRRQHLALRGRRMQPIRRFRLRLKLNRQAIGERGGAAAAKLLEVNRGVLDADTEIDR